MEDAMEAEQAAHALALLSERAASAEPIPDQPVSTKKGRHVEEGALEYIRRKMVLLQQQSRTSTQQLQQQVAWLRQQMFSMVTKVRTLGADQEEADEEELEGLEVLLQQSISLLQFTEGKLKLMRESLQQQPVQPQEPPPPMPFPSGTPFPPTAHCAPPWMGFSPVQPAHAACPPNMTWPHPAPPLSFSTMPPPTLPPVLEHLPPPLTQPALLGQHSAEQPLLGQHPHASVLPSTNMRDMRGGVQSKSGAPRMRLLSEAFVTRCGFWPSGKRGKSSYTQQDALDSTEGASGSEESSFDDPECAQDVLDGPACEQKQTAFAFFCAKALTDIKASNPQTTMRDVAETLSHLWRDANPEQRRPFEEMADGHALSRVHARVRRARGARGPSPHMMPGLAHEDPAGDGTSPVKGLVSSNKGVPVPQGTPPSQQPASGGVPSTAFQLFCSHRLPQILCSKPGTTKSVQPRVRTSEAQQCLETLWNALRTEDKEHWHSEAKKQLLQQGGAVPDNRGPQAGVELERGDNEKIEDMEDDDDGGEDLDMDCDAGRGAQEQEQAPVQQATVMVRGAHSASSRNPVQRIPISTSMLQKTYCFPRNKAAKYLGVCPNVLKRICRDYRIERWPFRKLQSLDHLIKNAQEQASLDPKGSKEIVNELQRMKTEIFANPNLELDDRIKKLQRVNYKNDYKLRQHKGTNNGRGRKKHASSGRWIAQTTSQLYTPEREQAEDEDEDGDQKDGDEEQKDEEELQDLVSEEEEGDEDGDMPLDEQQEQARGLQTHLQPLKQEQQLQQFVGQREALLEMQQPRGQQSKEFSRKNSTSQGRQVGLVGPGAGKNTPLQPAVVTEAVPPVWATSIEAWQAQGSPPEQQPAAKQGPGQHEPSVQLEQLRSKIHRDCSQSPRCEEGHTSVTVQQAPGGQLNTPVPIAENEIVPRMMFPGHPFNSNLNNMFGSDFVDENGCIDGQPYEPEMVMRLSTGGEERTLRRSMLARVFHLPIQNAAEALNMSTSWLKKISRSFCIDRWPYRKLQSLDHLLRSVEEQAGADPDDAAEIIKELRQIKKEIYSNPDAQLDNKIKRLRQANYKLEYKLRHNEIPCTASGASPLGTAIGREERTRSQQSPAAFSVQPANPDRRAKLPPEQQAQGQSAAVGAAMDQEPQGSGTLAVHVPEYPPASYTAHQPFPEQLPSSPEAMAAAAAAAVADLIRPTPELQQPPAQEQQGQKKQQND